MERLTHENRVLRREQRGGKRDEVVLQLETELVAKEQERATMEEQLSQATHAPASLTKDGHDRLLTSRSLAVLTCLPACCWVWQAFGAVIGEGAQRVAQLTAERDQLLVQLEAASKKKGFHVR